MNFKKHVSAVKVVFENVESVIFHVDLIDSIILKGLRSTYTCESLEGMPRLEEIRKSCESVHLGIKYNHESDLSYYPTNDWEPLLATYVKSLSEPVREKIPNVLGRLLYYNDIVCLEFLDESNQVLFNVYVPYEGEYENEWMTSDVDKENKLVNIQIDRL